MTRLLLAPSVASLLSPHVRLAPRGADAGSKAGQ